MQIPRRCLLRLAALLLLAPVAGAQVPLPILTREDAMGVNIHTTQPGPGELEMMRAAGFHWVRMDLTWAATEKQAGHYDFSSYDGLVAALDAHKMRALFVLDYGNPLYADPGDKQPFTSRAGTDAFRHAFAAWAAAAVSHFAGHGCLWEIWNEPNYKLFWAPAPDAAQYTALASAADAAIRKAAPAEPIIGPACSTMDFDFIERCCQAGLLADWAAISVHPYRRTDPSTATEDFQQLRALLAEYAPPGREIPIICSEWGYSAGWKDYDETRQAAALRAEFATTLAAGIPLTIWYDWRDDGGKPDDPETHFGLVHREFHLGRTPVYDPKPAYTAAQGVGAQLTAAPVPGGQ